MKKNENEKIKRITRVKKEESWANKNGDEKKKKGGWTNMVEKDRKEYLD